MASWAINVSHIDAPKNPEALADVVPLLERLVAAFGNDSVARLLDVESPMVVTWTTRVVKIDYDHTKRIMDLHDVFTRALRIFQPRTAMDWLVGNEPYLEFARPVDVLLTRGSGPLIEALEAIDSGGYAPFDSERDRGSSYNAFLGFAVTDAVAALLHAVKDILCRRPDRSRRATRDTTKSRSRQATSRPGGTPSARCVNGSRREMKSVAFRDLPEVPGSQRTTFRN
jgi:uncharacterized protein (DUF2384 family)